MYPVLRKRSQRGLPDAIVCMVTAKNVKGLDLKYCEYLLNKTANSTFTVTNSDTITVDTQEHCLTGNGLIC